MNRSNFTPYRACGIVGMLCFAWSWGSQTSFAQLTRGHVSQRSRWQWLSGLCQAVLAEICKPQPPFFITLIQKTSTVQISSFRTSHLACMVIPTVRGKSGRSFITTKEPPAGLTFPMGMVVLHQGWLSQGCITTLHPYKGDGHTQSTDFVDVKRAHLYWCQELEARPSSSVLHRAHDSLRNHLSTSLVPWSAERILDWLVHVPLQDSIWMEGWPND